MQVHRLHAQLQQHLILQAKYGMVADWEAATDAKLAHNAVMREYTALQAERTAHIDARRSALATKLFCEEEALQQELLTSRTTPDEKRAQLAARAKGLWEAREAERQATANALLERHFRCVSRQNASAVECQMSLTSLWQLLART